MLDAHWAVLVVNMKESDAQTEVDIAGVSSASVSSASVLNAVELQVQTSMISYSDSN